ncbi:MAG: hypothetical protein GY696_40700 [Gammaproteobacteria bacterium]|nr:hypothetical protein [Gammaproteobacteria bacterium]
MEGAQAYTAPRQLSLRAMGEMRAPLIHRPVGDEQRNDHAYIIKCCKELCAAIPEYRSQKLDN